MHLVFEIKTLKYNRLLLILPQTHNLVYFIMSQALFANIFWCANTKYFFNLLLSTLLLKENDYKLGCKLLSVKQPISGNIIIMNNMQVFREFDDVLI